ncbi:hypothetical protein EX30DRAFT_375271 [Ascodesmis nigricans]|uniref:Uncharacterized protein n=1 Tax=Ascodesmis nigricans TaxID=341454 RepID=A0A4S2MQS8_9PEZI|nr:hypothetical protein EX30DRAFT_375271 [Ascodesmis nigricans]
MIRVGPRRMLLVATAVIRIRQRYTPVLKTAAIKIRTSESSLLPKKGSIGIEPVTFDIFAPFLPSLVDESSSSSEDDDSDTTEPDSDPLKPGAADRGSRRRERERHPKSRTSSTETVSTNRRRRRKDDDHEEVENYETGSLRSGGFGGGEGSLPLRSHARKLSFASLPPRASSEPQPKHASTSRFGGFTGFLRGLISDPGKQQTKYTEEWISGGGSSSKGSEIEKELHEEDSSYYFGEEEDKESDSAHLAFGSDADTDREFAAQGNESSEDDGWADDWGFGSSKTRKHPRKEVKSVPEKEKSTAEEIHSDADTVVMAPTLPSRWADSSSEPSLAPSPVNGASPILRQPEEPTETEPEVQKKTPESNSNTPSSTINGKPSVLEAVANQLLSAPSRTATSTRSSSPNVRTTIKWQKRNVIIQIPSDSPWGYPEEEGGRPYPLSFEEVEKRLQHWRELGYNVDVIRGDDEAQIREVFPEERRGKVEASEIFVSIPDRRDWEAYCEALREEKLRALGVFDEPAPAVPSPVAAFRDSPLSHMASPAVDVVNPFSPPSQPASAMGNSQNAFSPFAPISIPASGAPGPAAISSSFHGAPHLPFHIPRSSVSVSGTPPAHEGNWDAFPPAFSPPIPRQTPPMSGPVPNPGIWGAPSFGGMRNGSPMGVHGHSQSVSYFGQQYPEQHGEFHPVHGLVGQERSFQQGVRRGSPLAMGAHGSSASISPVGQRRNIWVIPEQPMPQDGPAIDAPVPQHRHQLSLTLQKEYENQEGYQHDEAQKYHNQHIEVPEEGFNTNPVSPAPLNYPDAPEMPSVENDVHNGPELMSNPDDDVSDEDEEKRKNKQEALSRQQTMEFGQNEFTTDQYAPHSRHQSLAQRQMGFDENDPIQHSAMSMLMAGEGLGDNAGMNVIRDEDALSDAARTNISDILTNPSVPASPNRKYSTTGTPSHSGSNWLPEHTSTANSGSAPAKPKFNPAASEFDPTKSFTFNPSKITPFTPGGPPPIPEPQEQQPPPPPPFGSFGAGFNTATSSFQPTLAHNGLASYLEKGAAAFSPSAPEFKPSWATPAGDMFGEVVPPAAEKKFIPIVKPESRDGENAADQDRESQGSGSKKRMKQSRDDGNDVPQFETPTVPESKEEEKMELSPIEKTAGQSDHEADTSMSTLKSPVEQAYEFKNQGDAERFANAAPTELGNDSIQKESSAPSRAESPDGTKIQDTPSPQPVPEISETAEKTPFVDGASFSIRPSAQEFNFDFQKTPSPSKKLFSLGDSRYAHTPSPPPSMPAPSPPVVAGAFMPPLPPPDLEDEVEDPEKAEVYGSPVPMPKPTDEELDDVFMYMDQGSEVGVVRVETEHDDGTVVTEDVVVDAQPTPHRLQALRSAGPSPSPRRAEHAAAAYRHRAASFSSDEDASEIRAIYSQPENSFMRNINNVGGAQEEADSDWNDMLSEGEANRLRPQSRLFFDAHVEELVGGLFQRRLEPVLRSLGKINEQLTMLSVTSPTRKHSTADFVNSDADDEEDTQQFLPPRSPRDRKLEKIKAAIAEVLLAKNDDTVSEKAIAEIKDLVLANKHDEDFARLETLLVENFAAIPTAKDITVLRASVEQISERVADVQPVDELRELLIDALGKTAQAEDVAVLRHTLRDVVAHSAQKTDLMDMNAVLEEIAAKMAVRADVHDLKDVLLHAVHQGARKEDLIPIHSILAEAFSKAAKSEDLINLKMVLNEIMNAVLGIDVNIIRHDVQQVSQETAAARHTLSEVVNLTRDNAENFDFRHNTQLQTMTEQHSAVTQKLADITAMVKESHKFQQSRASKSDMRRNLAEKELREENLATRNAVLETHKSVRDGFVNLNHVQPMIEDIRLAVGNLEATQPKLGDFCDGVLETVAQLPTFSQLEEVVRQYAGIEKVRHIIEEDRAHKVELVRNAIEEVTQTQPTLEDIRAMMEEVVTKQQMFVPINVAPAVDDDEVAELKRKLDDALRAQTHNEHRADEEFRSKMHWQEKAIEMEAKLKLAEEEAQRQKDIAEEGEARLKVVEEKRHQTLTSAQMRAALLEGAHQSLQKSVGDLSAKTAALEGNLKEARESEERHKHRAAKTEEENRELRRHIETLRAETEESIRVRERFREKFDILQENMRKLSLEVTAEQQAWRQQQQEMQARTEVLEARLAAETSKAQGLEDEVTRMQAVEKDTIHLRTELEAVQRNAVKQEESLAQLRIEYDSLKTANEALEKEMESGREHSQEELERLSAAMGTEIQAANAESAAARSSLEKQVSELQEQLNSTILASDEERDRLQQESSESIESHLTQLEEIRTQHNREIKELTEKHASSMADLKHRFENKLASITAKHDRAFKHVTEDADRERYFLSQKLELSQTETAHLKDHIASLKSQLASLSDNLKIANQAAQAAASAATTVKEMSTPHLSDERALRESLTVLQSQLQEREARIEELESKLAAFNVIKIKQTEGQLVMYREICEMRIDDLQEIIHACSLPNLDRAQLRDAATRLKASLDMQFQDAERNVGSSTPKVQSSATPAAATAAASLIASKLPSVATSAWANWRKSTASPAPSPSPAPAQPRLPLQQQQQESPSSRPTSSASMFLNGILTPAQQPPSSSRPPRNTPFIGRSDAAYKRPSTGTSTTIIGRERGESSASTAPRSGSALGGYMRSGSAAGGYSAVGGASGYSGYPGVRRDEGGYARRGEDGYSGYAGYGRRSGGVEGREGRERYGFLETDEYDEDADAESLGSVGGEGEGIGRVGGRYAAFEDDEEGDRDGERDGERGYAVI